MRQGATSTPYRPLDPLLTLGSPAQCLTRLYSSVTNACYAFACVSTAQTRWRSKIRLIVASCFVVGDLRCSSSLAILRMNGRSHALNRSWINSSAASLGYEVVAAEPAVGMRREA